MTKNDLVASRIFGRSKWIWPESPNWDIVNGYALFRSSVTLGEVPKRAPFYITADQSYRLYINGCYVARGPARGFQRSWPYDKIDVAPLLRKGANQIAIRAYNPGFSNFQYLSQGFAGLLVAAKWGTIRIHSDDTWKSCRQKNIRRDAIPTSLQLFPQEHIDLRDDTTHEWISAGFDDDRWISPVARNWDSAPWFSLEPRGTAMLEEREIEPMALLGTQQGNSASNYRDVRDVIGLRQLESRSHHPSMQPAYTNPLCVESARAGEFRSYLFDFGRTVVGSLNFILEGALGGEIIDTHYSESVDKATLTPDQVIPTHCRMAFGDRLVLREGRNVHSFYHHFGFRYLMITFRDVLRPLCLDIRLQWIGYPLKRKGSFYSTDLVLTRIWEACAWTQQCCSLDSYVDTPWREQAQWWGDARVQAWNTFHLNGDTLLFRRGIRQIASQTTPEGVTYGHAPTMAHNCILPDFTLIWFLTIWDYYWQTGSIEPFQSHRPAIEKALTYFEERLHPEHGLLSGDKCHWLFLDWAEVFKEGYSALYSLWLLHALRKLSALYALLPMGERRTAAGVVNRLRHTEKRVERGLTGLLGKDGLLHDGLTWNGKRVPTKSIHTQTLAITVGLDRKNDRTRIDKILRPHIRGEYIPPVQPSAYWLTYVFTELTAHGHGDEVVACIRRRWEAMAEYGTTWETFAPKVGDESRSHAWSAHPLFHLMQTIGGITQKAPAWKEVEFRPVFWGSRGRVVVPTPRGLIKVRWVRRGEIIYGRLELPLRVRARGIIAGQRPRIFTRSGTFKIPSAVAVENPSAL